VSCTSEGCGLLTLSASQLGAVVALILGAGLYLLNLIFWNQSVSHVATAKAAGASRDELMFTQLFWAILFITALYYAIAEWLLEERDYRRLRVLSKPLAYVEFYLRVALAGMFGIAAAGIPEPLRFGLSDIHASFLVLASIYVGFLFWDMLVAFAGEVELPWRVARGDFFCGGLTLGALWLHQRAELATLIVLAAALVPFGLLTSNVSKFQLWKRLTNRDLLR